MNPLKKLFDDIGDRGRLLPTVEPEELSVMVARLMEIDEEAFGAYAFSRDPMRGRFDTQQRKDLTRRAIECGAQYAEEIKKTYGKKSALFTAGDLGLKVLFPKTPAGGGNVLFAQFKEPDEISVFTDCVDKAKASAQAHALPKAFAAVNFNEILIAHELFHFLEYRDRDTIFTRAERAKLWSLGKRARTAAVVALSEIAGMAFAKRMLGLSFSPYVFDVFFVHPYNEQAACSLYREICKLTASWDDHNTEGE